MGLFFGTGAKDRMAKIVYAVAGEGFGHASRTHLIGQRFLDAGHEVIFAASLRALRYLQPYFGDRVQKIFGLSYDYRKGYVDPAATLWKNLRAFPQGHRVNREFFERVCAAVRAGPGGDGFRAVQRLVGPASSGALHQHRQ